MGIGLELYAVYDGFYRVAFGFSELYFLFQLTHFAVYSCACKACFSQSVQNFYVFTFFRSDYGSEQYHFCAFAEAHYLLDHLIYALTFDRLSAFCAVRYACACVQNAQIVVYLGYGADGGARVAACRFLIYRNGGGKPCDGVYVRLLHLTQELTRV